MGYGSKKLWYSVTGTVCTIGLILFVVLMPLSVQDVANDEYALKYNLVSRWFDPAQTPLQQGRYVMAPADTLFRFKRVYVLVSLENTDNISCTSMDGLSVSIEATFQYKLQADYLLDMYLLLGDNYQDVIQYQATGAIQDVCGEWFSWEFYYSRQAVQTAMNDRVDANLNATYCDGGFFQLINVEFDPSFSYAIQLIQTAEQDSVQAENERPQSLIQAETILLQSVQQAEITITNADAAARVTLAQANAQAMGINATLSAQLTAYLAISQELGLTGESLINYIAIGVLGSTSSVTIGVSSPAAFSFP